MKHSSGERLISWEDQIGFGLRYFTRGYAPGIYARRNQFTMMGDNGHADAVRQVVTNARLNIQTVNETPEMRDLMGVEDPEAGSAANYLLPNEVAVDRIMMTTEERIARLNHETQMNRIRASEIEERTMHISANAAAAATVQASKYNTDRVVEQQAKRDADEIKIKSLKINVTNKKIEAETKLLVTQESLLERDYNIREQEAAAMKTKSENDVKIAEERRLATELRFQQSKEVSQRNETAASKSTRVRRQDDVDPNVDFKCSDPKCKGVKSGPRFKQRKLYHDKVSKCKIRLDAAAQSGIGTAESDHDTTVLSDPGDE